MEPIFFSHSKCSKKRKDSHKNVYTKSHNSLRILSIRESQYTEGTMQQAIQNHGPGAQNGSVGRA